MQKSYCPNNEVDLIKYLYKESTVDERNLISNALLLKEEAKRNFDELLDMKNMLDELPLEDWLELSSVPQPSKNCIDSIMEFASRESK